MAERKSFLMRVDPALWGEIERWAADELRSVNAQVEIILREAIKRRRAGSSQTETTDADTSSETKTTL